VAPAILPARTGGRKAARCVSLIEPRIDVTQPSESPRLRERDSSARSFVRPFHFA
jgi:hypothetical protein